MEDKISLRDSLIVSDIKNVGLIVPLPNHYMSDMPQGRSLLQTPVCDRLFLTELNRFAGRTMQLEYKQFEYMLFEHMLDKYNSLP